MLPKRGADWDSTRLALDKFEGDLLGHQHIIREEVITPDTLPSSSRSSAIADEDLDKEDGLAYFSRPTTASSMTSARFSLDPLSPKWRNSTNSHLSLLPQDTLSKKFTFVAGVGEVEEEEQVEEQVESTEAEEEETIQNDVAFQRLSMILAGLQAQAEAAVSSPTTPLRQPGALDPFIEIDEPNQDEEMLLPGMSRSTSSSIATITDNSIGFSTSGPSTPRLTASFHRSSTLPFIAQRPSRRNSRIITDRDDLLDPFTIPPSPRMPPSPMKSSASTTSQPPVLDLPPTPPATLRKRPVGLDLPLPRSGISTGLSSPAALSRRGSYLVTDSDLESLLNEFLDITQIRNREGAYDAMFRLVWIYLLGGGVVWAAVGLVLGWGCRECSCAATS